MKEKLEKARQELEEILQKVRNTANFTLGWDRIERWKDRVKLIIKAEISTNEAEKFENAGPSSFSMGDQWGNFQDEVQHYDSYLQALIEDIEANPELYKHDDEKIETKSLGQTTTPLAQLEKLCERFHRVARQLRDRHDARPTLEINDEYDIQDLIHALLKIDFEDIRPEEWAPSYAGGSSRMDFLLKQEKVVLEIKKASSSLTEKQIGEQLIIDIQRYRGHPECKTLVCFIYDPEGKIGNPSGLITDLERQSSEELLIKVIIDPQ